MEIIKEELERVKQLHTQVGSEFVTSHKYKDDREWWVLGNTVFLLEQAGLDYPEYAQKTIPPDPDFITYGSNRTRFRPIEVGEVLRIGRRRGDEYKNPFSVKDIDQLRHSWESFISVLNDKFLKRYDKDTWLIVYHDLISFEISLDVLWHDVLLANAETWNKSAPGRINLAESPYQRILVLNSTGKALVEIHPYLKIIIPDSN